MKFHVDMLEKSYISFSENEIRYSGRSNRKKYLLVVKFLLQTNTSHEILKQGL